MSIACITDCGLVSPGLPTVEKFPGRLAAELICNDAAVDWLTRAPDANEVRGDVGMLTEGLLVPGGKE